MKNKILMLFILSIFLIGVVTAEESGGILIGKQNNCINLPQECASCSYVNLTTITNPDLTQSSLQISMNKNVVSFNYTFCNTSQLGIYSYCMVGDVDGISTSVCKPFEITSSGKQLTISSAVIYVVVLLFTLILFILCLYGAIRIESGNPKDDEGRVISINDAKHLKPLLGFFAYIFAIWIFFNLWQISISFLFIDMASQIFYFLFVVSLVCFLPVIIITAITLFVRGIQDKKLRRDLDRGVRSR